MANLEYEPVEITPDQSPATEAWLTMKRQGALRDYMTMGDGEIIAIKEKVKEGEEFSGGEQLIANYLRATGVV